MSSWPSSRNQSTTGGQCGSRYRHRARPSPAPETGPASSARSCALCPLDLGEADAIADDGIDTSERRPMGRLRPWRASRASWATAQPAEAEAVNGPTAQRARPAPSQDVRHRGRQLRYLATGGRYPDGRPARSPGLEPPIDTAHDPCVPTTPMMSAHPSCESRRIPHLPHLGVAANRTDSEDVRAGPSTPFHASG